MKFLSRVALVFVVIIGVTCAAYAIVLPQPTRCLLIDFYDFEKDGNLYYRQGVSEERIREIKALIVRANERVERFWEGKVGNPDFVYCESDEDYLKFGAPFMTPAAATMSFNSYVVISNKGVDLDILSHEISHVELFERIGMYNRTFKIPTWFDEGLAMQVDLRDYYCLSALKEKSNNLRNLPKVTHLTTGRAFGQGTRDEVMLNYMTASYQVAKWYTPRNLSAFIYRINNGDDFKTALGTLN